MNLTRRSFLRSLAALVAAPFLARFASAQPKVKEVIQPPTIPPHSYEVEGLAIKVPSNRFIHVDRVAGKDSAIKMWPEYHGDWDGTFKLEKGCSNPAYILADLMERTGVQPDWITAKPGYRLTDYGKVVKVGGLNWQMIYDWGTFCDELVTTDWTEKNSANTINVWRLESEVAHPRFTVNAFCQTREDMISLREDLRMHCLSWQSQDERYRTSWPGIPYPDKRLV